MTALSNEPELRRALDAAGVAVASFDGEGHAVASNEAFASIFAKPADSIVGMHLVGLCAEGNSAAVTTALIRLVGGVSEAEVVDVAARGSAPVHTARLTLVAINSPDAGAARILCIGNDPSDDRTPEPGTRDEPRSPDLHAPGRDPRARRRVVGGRNESGQPSSGHDSNDVSSAMRAAVRASAETGYPFSLLACHLTHSTTGAGEIPARVSKDLSLIAEERLSQRLRPTDAVLKEEGSIFVLAQSLGDLQDAAGVAYRLLSSMVEPITTSDGPHFVHLTIGVAVADGAADPEAVLDASRAALDEAVAQGTGGFSVVDVRPLSTP